MDRRQFILRTAAASAALVAAPQLALQAAPKPNIGRWRGFNLLNYFSHWGPYSFSEEHFRWISDWGFNYIRLPLSYWCWTKPGEYYKADERVLEDIDRAVDWARKYHLHISLNLHRAPGFCINPPQEPQNLFTDAEALEGCAFQWAMLAKRYRGVSARTLSFNLLNEVTRCTEEQYTAVARRLIDEIRRHCPKHFILLDGMDVGSRPLMSLAKEKHTAQCGRGYNPTLISHYAAEWVYGKEPMYFPKDKLSWPLHADGQTYNRAQLRDNILKPWKPYLDQGGRLFIGEFGAHNQTPHPVVLAWMEDLLATCKELGIGWALWGLNASFGILNSGRADVDYEDFHGHKLDRKLLSLLQKYA